MQSPLSFWLLSAFTILGACNNTLTDPIVTIPSLGPIRGSFMTSTNGWQFLAFRGIRYGKAPVGELRFKLCILTTSTPLI